MNRRAGSMNLGRAALVGCVATALASTGCSFVLVRPVRDHDDPRAALGCTTSPGPPVVDTLLVLTNGISVLSVASQDNLADKSTPIGLGLTATALWLASAIYGYHHTARCRELQPPPPPAPPPRNDDPAHPPPTNVAPPRPQGPPRLYE